MPRPNRTTQPPSTDPLDYIGKLVGLLMSVVFFAIAIWYLVSGTASEATGQQQQVFYALMIILGGPIPFFFVSNVTSLSLKTPLGFCTIGGGYAIAIFACYFVTNLMEEKEVWRRFSLDNLEQKIASQNIRIWAGSGAVELHREVQEPDRPFQFICFFPENQTQVVATIEIPDPVDGFRFIQQPLLRRGNRFQTIAIYRHAGASQSSSLSSNTDNRDPL
jgi:hypothetical protein